MMNLVLVPKELSVVGEGMGQDYKKVNYQFFPSNPSPAIAFCWCNSKKLEMKEIINIKIKKRE